MPKRSVTLRDRKQIADATWLFTLGLGGQPFPFKPGQTVDLIQPRMAHADPAGNRRTFSIASAPGRDSIQVATRFRGAPYKRSLIEAPIGSDLEMDGPYGSFNLPSKPTNAALWAGGIGVTPFRAMAEDALERSMDHTLTLFHSNRTPEEAPFLDELLGWAARGSRFHYRPTMTRHESSRRGWTGEHRRVQASTAREWIPTGVDLHYVAGPERFVTGVTQSLKDAGVDEDKIRVEEFPGY